MDDKKEMMSVPFVVFDGAEAKHERTVKRLIATIIIISFLMFASNALWLYAWMQYDYSSDATTTTETSTVTVDGKDGIANYIGNNGDITNGKSDGAESKSDTDKNQNQGE